MKKLFLGIVSLAVFSPSAFAAVEDHNKITMVTYFPVPYVAYSEINPSKQLDIGLSNTCSLKLGCSEEEHTFDNNTQTLLTVTNLNVKNGRLNLNAPSVAVVNKNSTLGTSFNGAGEINFKTNARMQTLKDALSVSTDNMELSTLKLFPDHINNNFPACAGEDMAWQKLKLKKTEEVYLVCGSVGKPDCSSESVKTRWDGSRCACPNYYDYYVPETNTCCNDGTPKTDSRCWTFSDNVYKWQAVEGATAKRYCIEHHDPFTNLWLPVQNDYRNDCSSRCSDPSVKPNLCHSTVKEGDLCHLSAPEGAYKGYQGEFCSLCSEEEPNYVSCPDSRQYGSCRRTWINMKGLKCVVASTEKTYTRRWKPGVNKNY